MFTSTSILFLVLGFLSFFSESTSALSPSSHGGRRRHHARLAAIQRSSNFPSDTAVVLPSDYPSSVLASRSSDDTIASRWTHSHCSSDNWFRVIPSMSKFVRGKWSSASACLDYCETNGYTYAGLEYGYQCFCSNGLRTTGLLGTSLFRPKQLDESRCAEQACDDGTNCGGTWALDIYSLDSSAAAATSSIAASTSSVVVTSSLTTSSSTSSTSSTAPVTIAAATSATPSSSSSRLASSSMVTRVSSSASPSSSASSSSAAVSSSSAVKASSTKVPSVSSSTLTSTSSAALASATAAWTRQGCVSDSPSRVLTGYSEQDLNSWTIDRCNALCQSKGFAMAGIEVATQCYCGDSLASSSVQLAESACTWYCFNSPDVCGGPWALSIFSDLPLSSLLSGDLADSGNSEVDSNKNAAVVASSSAVASASSTYSAAPVQTTSIPSSSSTKAVYVHMMVGNTYPYTYDTWLNDIKMASAAGFDGFALNIGTDWWQWTQVASAYAAALGSGTGFKLFLSYDMTVLPCSSPSDAALLISYITTYAAHPNQAYHGSEILASTFAGSQCTFGISSSWDTAWQTAFKSPLDAGGLNVFFVPSVFSDVGQLGSVGAIDGELNWNSGWPMGGTDLDFSSDTTYMNALGSKAYMAAISPVFFTHYGVNSWNKNWIYRSDDWLYAYRWEALIANRDKFDLIEALTWNDYGESSYIGPIEGAQPNSEAWVDGFDHTPLLAINSYYAEAFKTGVYPTITSDRVYLTARPHPKDAVATSDSVGRPSGADYTDDNFYALVFATSPCTVTLSTSSSSPSSTTSVSAGVTRLKFPLAAGQGMTVKMTRDGNDVVDYTPDFEFVQYPATYNFNYHYFASS